MVKKYIVLIKSHVVVTAMLGVVLIAVAGGGLVVAFKPSKAEPVAATFHSPPEVKSETTNQSAQAAQQTATPPTANVPDATKPATTSTTTPAQTTNPVVTHTPFTPAPTPTPTPTITSLYLGQPYFDDNQAPIVTFTVPVSASGSGNVTITWVQDVGGATVCSTTVVFATNESKEVNCTASIPTPPQGVWATATAGAIYARTATLVYIGGTSWE